MSDRIQALEDEVADLRDEVRRLAVELARVKRDLRDVLRSSADSRDQVRGDDSDYSGSFSRVSRAGTDSRQTPSRDSRASEPVVESHASSEDPAVRGGYGQPSTPTLTWLQRDELAADIGRWIRRCLEGRSRGLSGRERNPLASRLYVVVRDIQGQIYTPVRVFRSWASCKLHCKRGQDFADSLYVGFPSEREAQRAVSIAGLEWPAIIEQ